MKTKPTIQLFTAKIYFLAVILLFPKLNLNATHIVGGEMSYVYLGSNTYKINLTLYRDCILGQAPYDNPASITIWNVNGDYIQTIEAPFTGHTLLPYTSADTNWVPEGYVCVEKSTYTDTVYLTQSGPGYIFAYQRCCRTNDITNLLDPGNVGATYWVKTTPGSTINSSPIYNVDPPIALCLNRPMTVDFSSTDPDGDSLVYRLYTPYEGATPFDPQPYSTSPPPFQQVVYAGSYTFSNPIDALPGISIDPVTGIVQVTPTVIGNFVIGVACDQYRNGVYLGFYCRDFRFSTPNCPYGIGVENINGPEYNLYPNPSNDFVNINSEEWVSITVRDLLGKLVYTSATELQQHVISTQNWSKGVYLVEVKSSKGLSTGKLIKNE